LPAWSNGEIQRLEREFAASPEKQILIPDVAEVERWSVGEGMRNPFRRFKKELERFPKKGR